MAHSQQRGASSTSVTSAELVTLASTPGVRAVTSVTASAVVTTNLTPVQAQPRSLVTQVTPGKIWKGGATSLRVAFFNLGHTLPEVFFNLSEVETGATQSSPGLHVDFYFIFFEIALSSFFN